MAKLVRCDRCGAFEPEHGGYDVTLAPQSTVSFIDDTAFQHDLCCRCAADLKAFMRNENVSRRYNVILDKGE